MKKTALASAVLVAALALQFCTSTKKVPVTPMPPPVTLVPKLNYETDIKPLVLAKCSPCHIPPQGRKEPYDTYAAVKGDINDIIRRIKMNPDEHGFMPVRRPKLSDSAIHVFEQWKTDGLIEK